MSPQHRSQQPSLTATRLMVLLFSDVVGSTALKNRLGTAAYSRLLARHDRLFADVVAASPGAQILKDTGDGYFASFASATEAVRAALRFQHALGHEPWASAEFKARVGIHLGEVAELDSEEAGGRPKVVGVAADIAARIMSLAQGGQILLTDVAFNEARQFIDRHPAVPPSLWASADSADVADGDDTARPASGEVPELRWVAHGPYLFKGADERIAVFEVGAVGVAPLSAPPGNDKARRVVAADEEETLGWRPGVGLEVPGRPAWVLEKRLGEGGFGEVWLGRHRKLGQRRVFKFCYEPDRLRSLKREMTLFRLMREALGERKDIARLYEVRLDEPPFFLESEYTQGGDLADWAAGQGGVARVPLATRLDLVARTADAVAAAHSVGIFHKDIKPANILVYEEEGQPRPRLADFGIGSVGDRGALRGHNITVTGFTVVTQPGASHTGTQMYLPPELLAGKPFTMQGDVYSLGVLLYQMVVGELGRPLAMGWERDVADDELLREDVAACVDGDPTRRLASAAELARRLRSLDERRARRRRAAEAQLAEERRLRDEAERAARRRRLRYLAAAAAVCLVALTVAWRHEYRGRLKMEGLSRSERASAEAARLERANALGQQRNAESEKNNALRAKADAEAAEQRAERARDAEGRARREAEIRLAEGNVRRADALTESGRWQVARQMYLQAYDEFRRLGQPPVLADVGYAKNFRASPPPVNGWPGVAIKGNRGAWEQRVNAAAFSPVDGKLIATGGTDGTVTLWDATTTGHVAKRFDGHRGGPGVPSSVRDVNALAFSRDGRLIVSGSEDGTLKLWRTAGDDRSAAATFAGHKGAVRAVAFAPDGLHVASGGADGSVRIWAVNRPDAAPRELVAAAAANGERPAIQALAYSPDGRRLAAGGQDDTPTLWDLETARGEPLGRHDDDVTALAFAPDNRTLASGGRDGSLRLWDVGDGVVGGTVRRVDRLGGHRQRVNGLAFAPDGQSLASAGADNVVRLWDVAALREQAVFSGHGKPTTSVGFSPDGRRLVAGGSDRMVLVWDIAGERALDTLVAADGSRLPVYGLAFAPGGRVLATTGADRVLRLWDVATGRPLRATPVDGGNQPAATPAAGDLMGVAFSPDGAQVAVGAGEWVRRWDVATGRPLPPLRHGARVRDVAYSPAAGGPLASAGEDGCAILWDADRGTETGRFQVQNNDPTREPRDRDLTSVAFSPDGVYFVVGCADKTAKVVETARPSSYLVFGEGHASQVTAAAFAADGRHFVTSGRDGQVVQWDARSRPPRWNFIVERDPLGAHDEPVNAVSVCPELTIAATGGQDGTLKIWDLRPRRTEGRELATLSDHFAGIERVAFAPDGGRRLACAGDDGAVRLWRLDRIGTERELAQAGRIGRTGHLPPQDPGSTQTLLHYGQWYAYRGVDDWAADFFERARAKGAAVGPLTLARCHWRAGHAEAARRWYQAALDAATDDAERRYLSMCLEALAVPPAPPAVARRGTTAP